jgi:hypothetical protein
MEPLDIGTVFLYHFTMKTKLYLFFFLLLPHFAKADAIIALKEYIPLYEHLGTTDTGQRCSIDFFRYQDALKVDLLAPRFQRFILTSSMFFESSPRFFKASQPSFSEAGGMVTMSLVFRGRDVQIRREFCKEKNCWSSGVICHLESW